MYHSVPRKLNSDIVRSFFEKWNFTWTFFCSVLHRKRLPFNFSTIFSCCPFVCPPNYEMFYPFFSKFFTLKFKRTAFILHYKKAKLEGYPLSSSDLPTSLQNILKLFSQWHNPFTIMFYQYYNTIAIIMMIRPS